MTARLLITLFVAALAACSQPPQPVPPMRESGELVVLTVNGPATYFEDAHGHPSGLEYDLATGECFSNPDLVLQTYRTRIVGGMIEVELSA